MHGHHSSHQHKDSNTSDSKISHHDLALILEGDQRTNVRLYLNGIYQLVHYTFRKTLSPFTGS
jgi:hypothetical protein